MRTAPGSIGPSIALTPVGVWALLATAAGCARPTNPWVYAEPPAVSVVAEARPVDSGRTVIAVAQFANPDLPQLDWPDVGPEMSSALRRALYNDTDFEIRIAPEIEQSVSDPSFLNKSSEISPQVEVDFVVIGKITDFHHTAALPKDASRWGLILRRHEAVVAIEWKVVDVRARRVIAADHTYGTAKASGKKSIQELYAGLDVSAYLFWNTPLGRAGHEAIDKTIHRMREVLPSRVGGEPRIVQVLGPRKVSVQGGWKSGLADGQEYYIVLPGGVQTRPVYDGDTGRPLVARISDVRKSTAVAWLVGKPPQDVDLRGALLTRDPATPPDDLARRNAVAGSQSGDS